MKKSLYTIRYPVTRLSGYPVIRLSGYPVIRLSGYPVIRLSGYPVIRLPADNTSRNEIRPLFALVKLAPPLHKHYYIQLNLSNRKPLMSCLFTRCIKNQVIELQRAIVPELLGV